MNIADRDKNSLLSLFRVISFALFCLIMGAVITGCYNNCDVNIDYCGYKNSYERNNDPEHQSMNSTIQKNCSDGMHCSNVRTPLTNK